MTHRFPSQAVDSAVKICGDAQLCRHVLDTHVLQQQRAKISTTKYDKQTSVQRSPLGLPVFVDKCSVLEGHLCYTKIIP